MALDEECLEYHVFLDPCESIEGVNAARLRCHAALTSFLARLRPRLQGCIWQREPFTLWMAEPLDSRDGMHTGVSCRLWGRMCFGESIDDEWFAVGLLLQLSAEQRDLTICVRDNDGDFLLIEAAYCIPRWLSPENAANRVFLRHGSVHILSPSAGDQRRAAAVRALPSLPAAVEQLLSSSGDTRHAAATAAICARASQVPSSLTRTLPVHRARCVLPLQIAQLLHAEPQLVGAACACFHGRSAPQMRAAATLPRFSPRRSALVDFRVTFSRCMFAQLSVQKFLAPGASGFDLAAALPQDRTAVEMGCKLTFGIEILCQALAKPCSDAAPSAATGVSSEDVPSDLQVDALLESARTDDRWLTFLRELGERGFFRGELPSSPLHQRMLREAARAYLEPPPQRSSASWRWRQAALAQLLLTAQPSPLVSAEELPRANGADDSLQWMEMSEEGMEEVLRSREGGAGSAGAEAEGATRRGEGGGGARAHEAGALKREARALRTVASSVGDFISGGAGIDGAEVPSQWAQQVALDPALFMRALESALGNGDGGGESGGESGGKSGNVGVDTTDGRAVQSAHRLLREQESDSDSAGDDEEDDHGGWRDADSHGDADEPSDTADEDRLASLEELMAAMDAELHRSAKGDDFERKPAAYKDAEAVDEAGAQGGDDEEPFRPVDLDLNLVKNLLSSHSSQFGQAGPASNLVGSMGLELPSYEAD